MTFRRLLPLLCLLALAVAPFGRMAAAEAMAMPHHAPMAMAGHCDDGPSPDRSGTDKQAIDCMVACAALMTADEAAVELTELAAAIPCTRTYPAFAGLNPEADPPPPRFS